MASCLRLQSDPVHRWPTRQSGTRGRAHLRPVVMRDRRHPSMTLTTPASLNRRATHARLLRRADPLPNFRLQRTRCRRLATLRNIDSDDFVRPGPPPTCAQHHRLAPPWRKLAPAKWPWGTCRAHWVLHFDVAPAFQFGDRCCAVLGAALSLCGRSVAHPG